MERAAGPAWPGTAALLSALAALAGAVVIGLAVIGQFKWRSVQEYQALCQALQGRNAQLQDEVARLKSELLLEGKKNVEAVDFLKARQEALEAQVAQLQRNEDDAGRRNLELQRKRDELEARLAKLETRHNGEDARIGGVGL